MLPSVEVICKLNYTTADLKDISKISQKKKAKKRSRTLRAQKKGLLDKVQEVEEALYIL